MIELCFHCDYQVLSDEIIVFIIYSDFLNCSFHVIWRIHHAKVFPDELLSCAEIEAKKIGVKGYVVELEGELVPVRNTFAC